MTDLQKIFCGVFAVMTILGFALMGADKAKAEKGKWRVKEATLFLVSALLGGVGTTLGMFVFRHKTQHLSFRIFLPLCALCDVAATVAVFVLA